MSDVGDGCKISATGSQSSENEAEANRAPAFQRNQMLETLLSRLEGPLGAAETALLAAGSPEPRPIVLIVGCARTGSSLLLQLLAKSGAFAVPSNFLSRFYSAPVLGAWLQRMLFDPTYDFRGELRLRADEDSYYSQLGKTTGALSPHDFFHFWRRWFNYEDGSAPTLETAHDVAFHEIQAELQGVTGVFGLPLIVKAQVLNWILPLATERLRDSFVVFLRREPLFTAQSLLEARMSYFGSYEPWYSLMPPEFDTLSTLAPEAQVAGQVLSTERAVVAGLRHIDPTRVIELTYEELTSSPESAWWRLTEKLVRHPGCQDLGECPRTEPFISRNEPRLPSAMLTSIQTALG